MEEEPEMGALPVGNQSGSAACKNHVSGKPEGSDVPGGFQNDSFPLQQFSDREETNQERELL
jgi:hypothetical protein